MGRDQFDQSIIMSRSSFDGTGGKNITKLKVQFAGSFITMDADIVIQKNVYEGDNEPGGKIFKTGGERCTEN